MLNGSALNGAMLNGGSSPQPAREIVAAESYRWRLRLLVAGVDWTARLSGTVEIDREEGAAGIARFALCLPPGPLLPTDWKGRPVTLDYLGTAGDGSQAEARRYTGRIAEPLWDRTRRFLSCTCSDQLQQQIEAMDAEPVEALVGGHWSADLFEAVGGRSHWDYAQERLASRPAVLDAAADGSLRVTSWFAQSPHFRFGPGTTVYDSLAVELSDLGEQINQVVIKADYRFDRLWQHNQSFGWYHPQTEGHGGIQGFCTWLQDSTDLPDKEMVQSAIEGAGLTLIDGTYTVTPPSGVYCTPPQSWYNPFYDQGFLLSFSATGARRWTQAITEQYRLTVSAEQSVADVGPIVRRETASVAIETDAGKAWEESEIEDGSTGHTDERADERRVTMLETLLRQAETTLYAAHRGNTVSWTVPTGQILEVDLIHTLEVNDQDCHAVGKCRRIVDTFDLAGGTALTRLSIAVMRGGGSAADPLTAPPSSAEPEELPSDGAGLGTQLGGRSDSGTYDDTRLGFSGNYSIADASLEVFPRRFDVEAIEIPATFRDEYAVEIAATYRVAIPNDTLELT